MTQPPTTDIAVPGLDQVFTITAEIGEPRTGGDGPIGERLHIPITGGHVEGPRLSGTIAPGGSDWALLRRDGPSAISARYTIIAADGTPIQVINEGLRVSEPAVTARLRAGEAVDPSEFYFRSSPIFEAPYGSHDWLNNSVFVASLARRGPQVVIAVYRVT
jgi:Protein of unknown function (DUF3237)